MCESCEEIFPANSVGTRRLKLWDLETGWHCTIVGTCLSMGELRRLAAKQGVVFHKSNPTDYEMHTGMIRLVSQERAVAKAITKLLDQKHAAAISRFRRAATAADLEALWREAVEKGEVSGACWALMAHPVATEQLRSLVFGEIHMLSHQVGAAARVDLKRFHALQTENAALEATVVLQQERLRTEIGTRDTALRNLQDRLDRETALCRGLTHAAGAAAELAALRSLAAELKRRVSQEEDGHRTAKAVAREADIRAAAAERDTAALRDELHETRAELAALEGDFACDAAVVCDRACGRPDLCGRCILYVGGRTAQVHHLRRVVEECNGTLVHHDGGFEEGMGRLSGLLSQADAVMFPVDCVSHMAHDQLKRLCKRWEKPFVPVRRSGLGAFVHALDKVGRSGRDDQDRL
jgi:hypothetical protein